MEVPEPMLQRPHHVLPMQARPTLLVADDYPENLQLFTLYLRRDYEVVTATTAEEAAERIAEGVDAALLDLNYQGGMTGLDLIQRLRANRETASVRALALTAHASPEDRDRCLAAGFDAYLAKPVMRAEMLAAVEALLDEGSGRPREVPKTAVP